MSKKHAFETALILLLGITGCMRFGMPAPADQLEQVHEACTKECTGSEAPCSFTDKVCLKAHSDCVHKCERYYGYRSGGSEAQNGTNHLP